MIEVIIREVSLNDKEGINEIRKLVTEEGVHDLTRLCCDEEISSYALLEDYEFFVAVNKEKVIGYIEMSYYKQCSGIFQLFVHPKFRKQGIGKKLINWLVATLQMKGKYSEIYLQIKEGNRAIGLYEREGFMETKKVNGGIEMGRKITQ